MTEDEKKTTKDFDSRLELRDKLYDTVKDLLLSTTEEHFKELGIKPVEKYQGEYGTGEKFGTGSEEGKYNIRLIGKTKSFIEKDIILGAKRTQSMVALDLVSNMAKIHYDTTERSMGRYNADGPLIINSSITIDMDSDDLKKELKKFFSDIAKQEVYYISETKLGIEDKLENHIDSISENTQMSRLSLKKIFFGSFEETEKALDEFINESKIKGDENHPEIKSTNTVETDNGTLLFDDEDEEKDEVSEITSAGTIGAPGTAGPFQYNTPYMFKKTLKNKKEESQRASIKKEKTGDGFWTTVDIEPLKKTHPIGMPGVEVNSASELKRSSNGNIHEAIDLSKRKFALQEENDSLGINKRYIITKKLSADEEKAKWAKLAGFTINESIKRAEDVIQECGCENSNMNDDDKITRAEYEDVVSKEFAELNGGSEENLDDMPMADMDSDDVISVDKPDSFIGYKFAKDDFLNENKYFIIDLITKQFVVNPNHISRKK